METTNHTIARPPRADELRWALEPTPRPEDVDILMLDDFELRAYIAELQLETAWIRRLLSEALTLVAKQRDDIARATRVVEHQRQQLRAERHVA